MRSPDLLNNVTIGQGQLPLIMEQIWFYHVWDGGHFGFVTKIFCIKICLLIIRSLHMKFEFNWANGFWENYVLIY